MCEYIKKTENRLTADEKRQLMDIFAPKNIAVPDEDPFRSLCVTADGNIRFYGVYNKKSVFIPNVTDAILSLLTADLRGSVI